MFPKIVADGRVGGWVARPSYENVGTEVNLERLGVGVGVSGYLCLTDRTVSTYQSPWHRGLGLPPGAL